MSIFSIVSIIALFLILSLSAFVLIHMSRTRANIYFVLIGLSGSFWIVSNLFADISSSSQAALFWTRSATIGPAFLPMLLYGLTIELYLKQTTQKERHNRIFTLYAALSFVIVAMSYSTLNVASVEVQQWGTDFVPGPLYYLLFVYLFSGFLWTFSHLFIIQKTFDEPYSSQARLILMGTFATFAISSVTNIVFPLLSYSKASLYGPPSIVFFVGFIAYAILKYRLFNIKVIAAESLSFLMVAIFFTRFLFSSGSERLLNFVLLVSVSTFSVLLVRGIIKDMEGRRHVEQLSDDLVVANEQLRQMDKQKSDFVSIASHQLRTPLTAIKGYASLLLENTFGDLPSKAEDPVKKIFEASQRMVMIVENFLTVSRIERGKMFYKFEVLDFQKIVADMVKDMRPAAEGYELQLRFSRDTSRDYSIRADIIKIKQVVNNLLDESIKHTSKGFIDVALTYSLQGEYITLSISDTGEGATKAQLVQMFERRDPDIKPGQMRKETGVELYIAKEIMKAHRGKVWAESEGVGLGLTFFVEVPRVTSKDQI